MFNGASCRCCLVRPPDKDLKTTYTRLGKSEVYADMLRECFEIHISEDSINDETGICEICIMRLRDASDFKQQVQRCQIDLESRLLSVKDESHPKVKEEVADLDDDNGIFFLEIKDEVSDFEDGVLKEEDEDDKNLAEVLGFNNVTIKKYSSKKRAKKRRLDSGDRKSKKALPRQVKISLRALTQMNKLLHPSKVAPSILVSDSTKHKHNIENLLKNSNCTPFLNKTLSAILKHSDRPVIKMFSIVLTKEGSSHLISVVPSTWVNNKDSVLFWPRTRKNSDLELLRRNEKSVPSENWRKLKCVVKVKGIATFAEGIRLEELYSNFEDTEDEERYHKTRENNRKHPAEKSIVEDLLNLNSDFEMMEDKEIRKDNDNVTIKTTMNEYDSNIYFNHASTSTNNTIDDTEAIETDASKIIVTNENLTTIPETESQSGETLISLSLIEFNQIITENSGLKAENSILKESNLKFQNLKEETERGFKAIQVQLDKLYDIVKHKQTNNETVSAAGTSVSTKFDEEVAQRNIEFPINSIKNLELLEDQLIDTDFENVLVKNFSRICGTSGMLKISKIGLQLTRCLFTDELLNQLTWKGIKGCTKVPFMNYIKTRNMFFKIIHLADNCCSAKDSDAFLQNSAIKHSGQRMKRNSSEVKIINLKKKKIETEKETATENEDPSSNNLETIIIHTSDKEILDEEINEGLQDGIDDKENKIGIICAYCKETYADLPLLREHIADVHTSDHLIDNKRMDKSNLSIKIDITDLQCKICNTKTDIIANLKKHLIKEHDIKFYPDVNDYVLEFKLTDGEILNCALCNSTFETFKMLLQHMNGHYRNYICEICDLGFINKHKLRNHQRTHDIGTFNCSFCDKIFSTRVRKLCHEKYTHNSGARYTTNCPHCDESFTSYYQRNRHMSTTHNASAATYKCNICDKSFILKSKLTSHIKKVHLMERNHICAECGQGFFIKQSLDEHMIKHNGERIYKCTVCCKAYARKKTLREHMRIHNNDRRFKCGLCPLAFVQKCSLKSHMLSNHGVTLAEYESARTDVSP